MSIIRFEQRKTKQNHYKIQHSEYVRFKISYIYESKFGGNA